MSKKGERKQTNRKKLSQQKTYKNRILNEEETLVKF